MARRDWFADLTGFSEGSSLSATRAQLQLQGEWLLCPANNARYRVGRFSTPSLGELRQRASVAVQQSGLRAGQLELENVLGDAADFHRRPQNRGATFQVASQFNCLEWVDQHGGPEGGVTVYIKDKTQGPCCAISAGAGTIYRTYFAPVGVNGQEQIGQSYDRQIENLRGLSDFVGNTGGANDVQDKFFRVQSGYTLASDEGLAALNNVLASYDEATLDEARAALRVGLQEDVQVTSYSWGRMRVRDTEQTVTQVFNSACSVSYSGNAMKLWEPFARLVLEASYEATLLCAVLTACTQDAPASCGAIVSSTTNAHKVFLTALGGGAFGNEYCWIAAALERALECVACLGVALDLKLVSYGTCEEHIPPELMTLATQWKSRRTIEQEAKEEEGWSKRPRLS